MTTRFFLDLHEKSSLPVLYVFYEFKLNIRQASCKTPLCEFCPESLINGKHEWRTLLQPTITFINYGKRLHVIFWQYVYRLRSFVNKGTISCHKNSKFTCSCFHWRTIHFSGHCSHENKFPYGKSTNNAFSTFISWYQYFPKQLGLQKGYIKGLCYSVSKKWFRTNRNPNYMFLWLKRKRLHVCKGHVEDLCDHVTILYNTEDFILNHAYKKLRSDASAFKCSPIHIAYFRDRYKCVKRPVFSCKDEKVIWNDSESSVFSSVVYCLCSIVCWPYSYHTSYFCICHVPQTRGSSEHEARKTVMANQQCI